MSPGLPVEQPRPHRHVLPLALSPLPEADLAGYFESLGNPTRLRIVERLAQVKEARVSDVALLLGISQPRMSWHLRLLRRARIVTTKREGREVLCRLDRESIAARLANFSQLLGGAGEPSQESNQKPGVDPAESSSKPLSGPRRERSLPEVIS
ncbi:MAG: helix-turn-helix transcriptional regulator [Candidatus Dormibacteraeota bacterium]|nr:helix-turn-helix transcriptional regulator [Candidatus Dormibacteraeota bacterium]